MKNFTLKALLVASITLGSIGAWAQDTTAPAPADNTKINQRDRNPSEPTADQQKNNQSDVELARQIRKALVKDKALSSNAHNVKVIVQSGMVTLKGPVNSDEEKQAVEAKAAAVAGSMKVMSELQVAAK